MKNILLLLFIITLNTGSVFSQFNNKRIKKEKAFKEFDKIKNIINSKTYSFVATDAFSLKGIMLDDLSTDQYYLEIDQDEADIYLPYLGEIHMFGEQLKEVGGIVFKGSIENYKVEFNHKKLTATIQFTGKAENLIFDFFLKVHKNGKSLLVVYSNVRSNISYDGRIKDLRDD